MPRLSTMWLLALAACCAASKDSPSSGQLVITSISVQGTNLVLPAAVPPDMEQVTLETRTALDAAWKEAGLLDAPAGGGQLVFTIPKPGEMALFRLKAKSRLAGSSLVSSELNYVVTEPLNPSPSKTVDGKEPPSAVEAVLHFKGNVAAMWVEDDALWVWFADNPNDRDAYEIEISFGQ